ncbi:terminus macrodomain insulation protein YfbV [Shewanella sp. NFH-SH190041]|uniref:terminus macrodomain insulation protein YfbV n=1 Tax=Shewanella sp. NFH-SH190041 TaxID=2950245 RepID=UPI0021C39E0B|nr:terminus macrodomain insulation protein YfbV [Shewanella sp. NFH-SH190041]
MSLQILTTVRDGRRYMHTWPMVRQLGFHFPEYRVIRATQLAERVTPALAVMAAVGQVYLYGWAFLPQALTLALFFLSLPFQGLMWLGWRARHPLPLSLLDWGNQLSAKLLSMGVNCRQLGAKACYQDMATLLKTAFERLDKHYWDTV